MLLFISLLLGITVKLILLHISQETFLGYINSSNSLTITAEYLLCNTSPFCVSLCGLVHTQQPEEASGRCPASSGAQLILGPMLTNTARLAGQWALGVNPSFTPAPTSTVIAGNHSHAWRFTWVLWLDLWSSCFRSEYLTDWAISYPLSLFLQLIENTLSQARGSKKKKICWDSK